MSATGARALGPHQQQMIDGYLADLDRVLAGKDAAEAADVARSVREHIDAALLSLGDDPSPAQVQAVLGELGPVERIGEAVPDQLTSSVEPARVGAPIALLVTGALAVLTSPWLIGGLLGLGVAIGGTLWARKSTNRARTTLWIATALGAVAVLVAAVVGFGLIASTSSSGGTPPAELISNSAIPTPAPATTP